MTAHGAARARHAFASVCCAALLCISAARAHELTPALPQTIHLGKPPGNAPLRGVDWGRSRRADALPPADAQVLWQRKLPGGLSANLVVDAAGRVFASTQGRVLQLGADGRDEYTRHTEFAAAAAVALLADGQRAVLSREGGVWSWSERGESRFMIDLRVPPGWTRGELLSLPEGGLLASLGAWLFRISARGELEGYTQLAEPVAETLISAGQTWIVGERGSVLRWDGRSAPVTLGDLGGRVSTAALRAPGRLLAVVDGHELREWSLATSERVLLARSEGAGDAGRLSVSSAERLLWLGANGVLTVVSPHARTGSEATSEAQRLSAGPGELLSGPDGSLLWLLPNAPLELRRDAGEGRVFSEIRCAQPASLLPAGTGRVVAACRSGQIWLVGPSAPPQTDPAPAAGDQPSPPPQ